jgi:predicted membrane channel-forming protein YqfA (hemolysin III family)
MRCCDAPGIAFFIMGEIKPIFHTVWHVFVMVGSLLHWLCIYHYICIIDIPGRGAAVLTA